MQPAHALDLGESSGLLRHSCSTCRSAAGGAAAAATTAAAAAPAAAKRFSTLGGSSYCSDACLTASSQPAANLYINSCCSIPASNKCPEHCVSAHSATYSSSSAAAAAAATVTTAAPTATATAAGPSCKHVVPWSSFPGSSGNCGCSSSSSLQQHSKTHKHRDPTCTAACASGRRGDRQGALQRGSAVKDSGDSPTPGVVADTAAFHELPLSRGDSGAAVDVQAAEHESMLLQGCCGIPP
mmetsp:Transcript_64303/g.153350  ORF Transcript_64303/g.153350 Transcript_64303/m.153350 type:complete len:240 (-) Transcript_64303:748-1467(-)